jgi:cation:H+ antiporter
MPDFSQFALPWNIGLFAGAAVLVWLAGTRLSHYADTINSRTGAGQAMIGLLLLAGVTSLPEIGVTVTSSVAGDTQLALNNLFGSIAMQVAMLAIVDFVIGKRALTSVIPEPAVMLQGSLNVLLLALVGAAMVVGDVLFFGVGAWSTACLAAYVGSIWLLSQEKGRRPWLAAQRGEIDRDLLEQQGSHSTGTDKGRRGRESLRTTIVKTVAAASVILVAGFVLSRTGSAIAEQTGIGSSFVGFVLVAISTSLPELSTALSAARIGRFTMAISDILGTNLINVGLVFVIDLAASGEPVLSRADTFSVFGVFLGIIVTTLFIAGLAERRDRTIWRMGVDSIAVLVVYAGGVAILYSLR